MLIVIEFIFFDGIVDLLGGEGDYLYFGWMFKDVLFVFEVYEFKGCE